MAKIELIHGDCLVEMKKIPDKSIDLVLTDPPYAGAGMKYNSYDDTDISKVNKLVLDFVKLATQKARIVIFPSGKFCTEIMLYQQYPPQWRLCWYKGACGGISAVGFNDWEMMMVYGEKICRNQHDFFKAQGEKLGNWHHPCPKPLDWAKWIIYRFCDEGGIVCDPFMGSGTVGSACKEYKRNFIGIEIDEKYFKIAQNRINQTMECFL